MTELSAALRSSIIVGCKRALKVVCSLIAATLLVTLSPASLTLSSRFCPSYV